MSGIFFEDIHKAARDFPYFDSNTKNINYISHFHEETEVVLVLTGEVDIHCEIGSFTAKEGDVCVFFPSEIHNFSSKVKNRLCIMKIHSKNSNDSTDLSKYRLVSNLVKCGCNLNRALSSLILSAKDEIKHKNPGYAYMINSISNQILCTVLRLGNIKKIDASFSKKHISALTLLETVNTYIENHYTENISLTQIARECNFSEYYFAHFFKETANTTFFDYLTAYRVEKAIPLLVHSNKNITETAYECGFSNTRALNRAFKKKFNLTPSEYIKQYK